MPEQRILIIDQDQARREQLCTVLEFIDHAALPLSQCDNWSSALGKDTAAVILGRCGNLGQLEALIRSIKGEYPDLPLIMLLDEGEELPLTGELARLVQGRIASPVRYGPLSELLENLAGSSGKRPTAARRGRRAGHGFPRLVGGSPAMAAIQRQIDQVADTGANVLILGESGTGKEVVARHIHLHSSRASRPFIPVNCGAIPSDLLESELFGHEKGAFTGAISARQGRFELAEGGTLFLDEIGDMSLPMQVKLLRVLQERTFERVGSNKTLMADVRIIAATHRDLEDMVEKGDFREDLYYRLNVFPIDMPPLRERAGDIPLLIEELVSRLQREGRGSVAFTPRAIEALQQARWRGNVRELANLVERMTILYPGGTVDAEDLPAKYRSDEGVGSVGQAVQSLFGDEAVHDEPASVIAVAEGLSGGAPLAALAGEDDEVPQALFEVAESGDFRLPVNGLDLKEQLNNLEVALIRKALEEADGVVAHAAKLLKMRRTTLVEKLKKYGLQRSSETS